jgi:hypothetical protein
MQGMGINWELDSEDSELDSEDSELDSEVCTSAQDVVLKHVVCSDRTHIQTNMGAVFCCGNRLARPTCQLP